VLTCVTALSSTTLVDGDNTKVTWVHELKEVEPRTLVIRAVTCSISRVRTKGVHTRERDTVEEGLRVYDLLLAVANLRWRGDVSEELCPRLTVTTVTLGTANLARATKWVRVGDTTACVIVTRLSTIVTAHAALNRRWRLVTNWVICTLRVVFTNPFKRTVIRLRLRTLITTILICAVCVAIVVVVLTVFTVDLRTWLIRPTWKADLPVALCTN
jgi:hypothetical protein